MDMKTKISDIKELFSNIHDTLSIKNKDSIRYNINKYRNIYKRYINKAKLSKAQQDKLNNTITILNEIHAYLLDKNAKKRNDDNISYPPGKSFESNDNYARNKIDNIKAVFNNICHHLSFDENKYIRNQIFENVKRYDAYKIKKRAKKKQRTTCKDIKADLNILYDHVLNKSNEQQC